MALKYVGGGNWYPGVPARDLTDAEVEEYGRRVLAENDPRRPEQALLNLRIYEVVKPEPEAPAERPVVMARKRGGGE